VVEPVAEGACALRPSSATPAIPASEQDPDRALQKGQHETTLPRPARGRKANPVAQPTSQRRRRRRRADQLRRSMVVARRRRRNRTRRARPRRTGCRTAIGHVVIPHQSFGVGRGRSSSNPISRPRRKSACSQRKLNKRPNQPPPLLSRPASMCTTICDGRVGSMSMWLSSRTPRLASRPLTVATLTPPTCLIPLTRRSNAASG